MQSRNLRESANVHTWMHFTGMGNGIIDHACSMANPENGIKVIL
jgi:hypothetical protein